MDTCDTYEGIFFIEIRINKYIIGKKKKKQKGAGRGHCKGKEGAYKERKELSIIQLFSKPFF